MTRRLTTRACGAFALLFATGGGATVTGGSPSLRLQSNEPRHTDLVIVAHQDDWQLFMGDALVKRLRSGDRMIFVYLTAGDDGRDSVYWRTRERAALQSTKLAEGESPRSGVRCDVVGVNGHAISECEVGNTASYFFRLPDGRRNGRGFAAFDYQSLRKLRAGEDPSLNAIDGSTSYKSWSELARTVGALAGTDSATLVIHTTDPNIAINPHDHFDHRMAGLLVKDLSRRNHWNVVYYVGYALATRAANRSSEEVRTKTELFLAYNREMLAANPRWGAYREHPAFYSACMQRTYARTSPRH